MVRRHFAIFSGLSHCASRCVASRCRPDLARRPRDVARIRERRQASRRCRKRGVRGFMFPLGIPFSCLTAFRFTSTSRRCTWNYHARLTHTCTHPRTHVHIHAHVQSRAAVRPDTKLCWIACRDPRVTWRDTRVRIGSARRSRAQMY